LKNYRKKNPNKGKECKCKFCGKVFFNLTGRKKFCSKRCILEKFWAKRAATERKLIPPQVARLPKSSEQLWKLGEKLRKKADLAPGGNKPESLDFLGDFLGDFMVNPIKLGGR
jgi:hypothetical protein